MGGSTQYIFKVVHGGPGAPFVSACVGDPDGVVAGDVGSLLLSTNGHLYRCTAEPNVWAQVDGGGGGTLQDAYNAGQTIDIDGAVGPVLFKSSTGSGAFNVGDGANDVAMVWQLANGSWTLGLSQLYLTAATSINLLSAADVVLDADRYSFLYLGSQVVYLSGTGMLIQDPIYGPDGSVSTLDVMGNVGFRLGGPVTLATGSNDDVDMQPSGNTASIVPLTVDAGASLTSIIGGVDGRLLVLLNSSAEPLVLYDNIGGTAPNRIRTIGHVPTQSLAPYSALTLIYDSSQLRWIVQGNPQGTERHATSTTLDTTTILQYSMFYLAAGVTLPNLTGPAKGTTIRIVSTDLVNPMNIVLQGNGFPSAGWTIVLSAGGGGTFVWGGAYWQCIGSN